MPGSCSRSTPARRRDRRSSWWPARSMRSRCCSAALAASCARCSRAATSKPDWEARVLTRRMALAAAALLLGVAPGAAQEKLKVVATFSILADVVKNVGGDRIAVTALVGPNSDAHVYQPSPADAKTLSEAKVVFANGLGFEGWMERLIKASGTKAAMVVASKGVKPRNLGASDSHEHQHATDPHAWQAVGNIKLYATNVRDALVAADPVGKATYE